MFGSASTELLTRAVTPEEILKIPTGELYMILNKAGHGRFGAIKAEENRNVAKSFFGITIGTTAFAMQLRQLLELISLLERQLDELAMKIDGYPAKTNTCITSCPSVENVLGATILGDIGDISRFPESKKLVAFLGINPSAHQYGEFTGT